MDGVLAARVHVVLPERGGVGENTTPSTAAVFIKHQAGYTLDALQPQIRKLVTHAIPGLTEDRVSIALVSAQPSAASGAGGPATRQVMGIEVVEGSASTLTVLLGALVLLVLALAGAIGFLLWRYGRPVAGATVRREPATEARRS
jgi:type III secretion protein J